MFTVRGRAIQTLRSIASTSVNMIYNIYCFAPGKFESILQKCDVFGFMWKGIFAGNGLSTIKYIPFTPSRVICFTLKTVFTIITVSDRLNSIHSVALLL